MLSSSERTVAPLYLELAPPADAVAQIDHLFVFRDTGTLSGGGSGRFATDLFTLSVAPGACTDGGGDPHVSLTLPRADFAHRRAPFCGIVAGLRLAARPESLPARAALEQLTVALQRAQRFDDDLPALVAALDNLGRGLSFAAPTHAVSDRTGRRRARADTGVSRRRLAAIRRFRQMLKRLASRNTPSLSDLALDAGYYDQAHMSAFCRSFAGSSPGALRSQAARRPFDLSLQDTHFRDRVSLVIMNEKQE